ncbi:LADA_0D03026g1_1 [Lachancea dasiensis]|uniref:D-arabinono-1,4-lactone oxidase n=1 Tax=Lachancea dasiensis TaxID=1072105 RepID=A0A1G4J4E5_9SACH|nr:LADA_0D03026g1_1 [Lachancea dasiensis]
MNLDKMDQVHRIVDNKKQHYSDVTVDAGMRIYKLSEYLHERGLAIQNLGSISEQSVGGIISTGTHGSSPHHGLISSQYVDLTIVNGLGEVVFVNSEKHPEIFRAASLSLGKIGIIVRATIRVVPAFKIKSTQEVIHFDTLLNQWDLIWTSSEFIRCWWYPYSQKCVLWRGTKTSDRLVTKTRRSCSDGISGGIGKQNCSWART